MTDNGISVLQHNISVLTAWIIAPLFFFPIFWVVLIGFKTKLQAIAVSPMLFFTPTIENFTLIQDGANYTSYAWNSIVTSVGGTALAMVIAIPAAYAMAFNQARWAKNILLWVLSAKMLPAVGVLMPIYLLTQKLRLLDTKITLVVIYALINLLIIMMILFNYFRDIPK